MGALEDFSEWLVPSAEGATFDQTMRTLSQYGVKVAPKIEQVIGRLTDEYPSVISTALKPNINLPRGAYYDSPNYTRYLDDFLRGRILDTSIALPHPMYSPTRKEILRSLFHETGHALTGNYEDLASWGWAANKIPSQAELRRHLTYIDRASDEAAPIQEGFADATSGLWNLFNRNPSKQDLKKGLYWPDFKLDPNISHDSILFDSYLGGGNIGRKFALEILEGGKPSQEEAISNLMDLLGRNLERRIDVTRFHSGNTSDTYNYNPNFPLFRDREYFR